MTNPEQPDEQSSRRSRPADASSVHASLSRDSQLEMGLFALSPFPAMVSRLADLTVLAANARTFELFGVSQDQIRGLKVTDCYVDPSECQALVDRLRQDGRADNLRIELRRPDATTFWAQASARMVSHEGETAVLTVFVDISEQVAAEQALTASESRVASQSRARTDLTAQYASLTSGFDERLRAILMTSARTLQVDRLSMWRFDDERRAIRCAGLYQCRADRHESGAVLARAAAPAYFAALEQERVIAAADA